MPKLLMTDRAVAGRLVRGKAYFDKKTPGLALRIGAKTRVWYFVYRNGGPPEWVKLGTYPAVTLAAARDLVLDKRRGLEIEHVDPAVERRKPPVEPEPAPKVFTFADFVPAFIAFQKSQKKSWKDDESTINRYFLPTWGALPLRSITRRQVHEVLDTAAGKGLTIGVNRIQAVISRLFTVALDRELIDAHPAIGILKRFPEVERVKVLEDDELRALWTGLDAHPGAASDAIRLRLLLGQRGGETSGMFWNEIDLNTATWTIAKERTKTRKREHPVGLPPTALALLQRRREALPKDERRVFPGLTLVSDEHKALNVLHGNAYVWKDLRRTVATKLAELGFGEDVIGRVLNHAKHSVTGKHYNQHKYLPEIRQALTAWDTELHRILANEPKSKTNVLPMRR
jgi:integrase